MLNETFSVIFQHREVVSFLIIVDKVSDTIVISSKKVWEVMIIMYHDNRTTGGYVR